MKLKAAGELVTLRVDSWDDDLPEEGDFVRTGTGRCYRIDEIRWRYSRPCALVCTVLDQDAVQPGDPGVWLWQWSKR
jgi:hypothetical protein